MLLAHHVVETLRPQPVGQRGLAFERIGSRRGEEVIGHLATLLSPAPVAAGVASQPEAITGDFRTVF